MESGVSQFGSSSGLPVRRMIATVSVESTPLFVSSGLAASSECAQPGSAVETAPAYQILP